MLPTTYARHRRHKGLKGIRHVTRAIFAVRQRRFDVCGPITVSEKNRTSPCCSLGASDVPTIVIVARRHFLSYYPPWHFGRSIFIPRILWFSFDRRKLAPLLTRLRSPIMVLRKHIYSCSTLFPSYSIVPGPSATIPWPYQLIVGTSGYARRFGPDKYIVVTGGNGFRW